MKRASPNGTPNLVSRDDRPHLADEPGHGDEIPQGRIQADHEAKHPIEVKQVKGQNAPKH